MPEIKFRISNKGISTLEILIVSAIIAVALISLLTLVNFSLKVSDLIKKTAQANFLAQETMEAVRNFRDGTIWDTSGLGTIKVKTESAENPYYPKIDTTSEPPEWTLLEGKETIDGFTRKIVFEKVFRDGNDNISESGAEDSDTRRVTITVSWQYRGEDKNIELATYFTNWKQ